VYPETSGLPGPRDPWLTPYMVPMARAVHGGQYKRVVMVCSAQSGKTETLLDLLGARLDQRPAPILYVGPIRDFLTDQFEPRLMSLLDEAETLSAKVVRGRRMKKTLKIVAGVPVRLAHAGSSAALKSSPAALALVDEYDEMLANVKGQGDPLGLVEARGETYADFVTAVTSTPSRGLIETELDERSNLRFWKVTQPEAVESAIWKLWQSGTRHHFCWPCLHCETYFVPRFEQMRWPENATPAEAAKSAQLQCPHCGGLHQDSDKQEMNARGLYVAPGQWIEEGEVRGEPPENAVISFWASGLASPFVSWGTRIERYVRALASGDPDQVQTALNAGFGECFTPAAGRDALDWQEILQRRAPYRLKEVPDGVLRLGMAVDVQKLSLYYTIRGFGARGRSWLIDRGQLYGPTDDDEVWNALADLMLSPIAGLQIERVFVDSGFRPNKPDAGDEHKVYEFTRRYPWLVSPTKGRSTMSPPYRVSKIEVTAKGKKASYSIDLVWLSTDFFKSLLVSRIRTPLDQPGSFIVPDDIDEDYAKQLVSEVRVVDGATGKPQWVQKSRANHYLDCEALAMAIGYSLNVQRIPEGVTRENRGAAPGHETGSDTDNDGATVRDKSAVALAAAAMPDLRSRFAGLSSRLNR
jgi:phage terminase large subunit GpA-like protein